MMQVETTRHFSLRFPQEMIREPILHNVSVKFGVAFCILSANVTESVGNLTLSFSSPEPAKIHAAIAYLRERGVDVRDLPVPVNG